jgi:hypothetical protein
MKRFLFFITIAMFCSTTMAQNWVGLTRNEPAQPEVTLTTSNNQQVSFTVELCGFYATPETENGVNYQRLSIPGHGVSGTVGAPEIPVITQRIAIPACSAVNYSVQVTASQTLQSYHVYPVPEWETDSLGKLVEVFTLNALTYQVNAFTPVNSYTVLETGAMRN